MPERGVVGCVGSVVFPVALAAIGYTLLVHQLQEKLIYMPREYASHPQHYARVKERARAALSVRHGGALELIEYTLPEAHGGGAQTAYFLRPAVSTVGKKVWRYFFEIRDKLRHLIFVL